MKWTRTADGDMRHPDWKHSPDGDYRPKGLKFTPDGDKVLPKIDLEGLTPTQATEVLRRLS